MVFILSTCSRITSRITSRVSSRIWCGAIWRICHLRADSEVWLSHTSSIWPWSGAPKVHLYDTFLVGLLQDHNKHVINGLLGKALADKEGLDLWKAIIQHTGTSPGTTFIWGSKPINGLWISSDLDISNACVMPFGYGIGNHCTFILDIQIESLVGVDPVKIVWPAGRRLNSRLPGSSKSYIDSLEANIVRHRLLEQLFDVHTRTFSDKEWTRRLIIINEEGKAFMRQVEKICRKIKCCHIPFFPEVAIWIHRVQAY